MKPVDATDVGGLRIALLATLYIADLRWLLHRKSTQVHVKCCMSAHLPRCSPCRSIASRQSPRRVGYHYILDPTGAWPRPHLNVHTHRFSPSHHSTHRGRAHPPRCTAHLQGCKMHPEDTDPIGTCRSHWRSVSIGGHSL